MKEIINILGKFKDLKRSGWIKREVNSPESVADHSFGVALLVYLLCPPHLDKHKCMEMAITHDLAEIVTGDFTPCDDISIEKKHSEEIKAIKKIAIDINKPEIVDLFIEYEEMKTPESIFVKEIDKIEALLQAKYYDSEKRTEFYEKKKNNWESLFEEFYSTAEPKISTLKDIFKKI